LQAQNKSVMILHDHPFFTRKHYILAYYNTSYKNSTISPTIEQNNQDKKNQIILFKDILPRLRVLVPACRISDSGYRECAFNHDIF